MVCRRTCAPDAGISKNNISQSGNPGFDLEYAHTHPALQGIERFVLLPLFIWLYSRARECLLLYFYTLVTSPLLPPLGWHQKKPFIASIPFGPDLASRHYQRPPIFLCPARVKAPWPLRRKQRKPRYYLPIPSNISNPSNVTSPNFSVPGSFAYHPARYLVPTIV